MCLEFRCAVWAQVTSVMEKNVKGPTPDCSFDRSWEGQRESTETEWEQSLKWEAGEALQIAVKRREAKSKGEKERYKHLNAEFQRIARRDKKAFFSD